MPPSIPGAVTTPIITQPPKQGWGFTAFGPGEPMKPVMPDQPARQFDYPTGVNSISTPRHTEPFSFAHLRAFANVELVRMAIDTRKDQLERLDWMVKPKGEQKKGGSKERDTRCAEVEKFLYRPDGVHHFSEFFRAVDEDLLALDAPCIERMRNRGGKLIGLEYVDGSTINLLVDESGRQPRGPNDVAFQQIIKGHVWTELTNADLIYAPRNVRSGHIYGFSPVETIIVTINTIIRRQASQLAYFTEGNVPQGIINSPEQWQTQQIREMQQWFDDKISGNQGEQRKLLWVPFGAKYQAFKDSPIKDEFDEWLARMVAFSFSLPPTPFVRQMNKGTAGEDQERALEEGLEPLKVWRKRMIDRIIEEEFGYDDLEFSFRVEREIDPKIQSDVDDKALRNGSAIIDEVRDARGLDPLPNGQGAKPLIYTSTGVITLEDALKPQPDPMLAPPTVAHIGDPQPTGGNAPAPTPKSKPGVAGASAGSKKNSISFVTKADKAPPAAALALSIDRPDALKMAKALKKDLLAVLTKAGKLAAKQVRSALSKAADEPEPKAEKIVDSIDVAALLADMEEPLAVQLSEIGADAGHLALASIGADKNSDLVNRVNKRAVAYAEDRAAELVSVDGETSLVETTRNAIRDIIVRGLTDNLGVDAIADNIQTSMAFSDARAQLIADTELAFANSNAKKEAWDDVVDGGATLVKQWFVSEDEGVCDECEGNDAQGEIPYDEDFESGDEMEPAHPGCRCVTVARALDAGEADTGDGEEE